LFKSPHKCGQSKQRFWGATTPSRAPHAVKIAGRIRSTPSMTTNRSGGAGDACMGVRTPCSMQTSAHAAPTKTTPTDLPPRRRASFNVHNVVCKNCDDIIFRFCPACSAFRPALQVVGGRAPGPCPCPTRPQAPLGCYTVASAWGRGRVGAGSGRCCMLSGVHAQATIDAPGAAHAPTTQQTSPV
jgi:hypothetical protein